MEDTKYSNVYLSALALLFLGAMHYYQVHGGGIGLSLSYNSTTWIAVSIIIAIACWKSATSLIVRWIRVDLALLIVFVDLLMPFVVRKLLARDYIRSLSRNSGIFAGCFHSSPVCIN